MYVTKRGVLPFIEMYGTRLDPTQSKMPLSRGGGQECGRTRDKGGSGHGRVRVHGDTAAK